ncbi:hypothetical protein L9F63_017840, partial [Diploptera punctata]
PVKENNAYKIGIVNTLEHVHRPCRLHRIFVKINTVATSSRKARPVMGLPSYSLCVEGRKKQELTKR